MHLGARGMHSDNKPTFVGDSEFLSDRDFIISDALFKFLTYQLWMVGYCPTMVVTGNGPWVRDSGEGA